MFFCAGLWSIFGGGVVGGAGGVDESVEFGVVEGAGDESAFALSVDELVAEDGALR
jgi:hypothetical protein